MKKWILYILVACTFTKVAAQDSYADKAAKYIDTYKELAIAEQQRSGVPAAVTLGQGILETEAGCSVLATGANNHFGIKCKSDWTGETFSHTDDAPDECFRKYNCAADSYKDHSDYLKNTPRYAALFRLETTDYSGWAYGLKRCGYATNPKYASKLIGIIEDFHLEDYTEEAMATAKDIAPAPQQAKAINHDATPPAQESGMIEPNAPQNIAGKIVMVNGLKAVYAYKGDQLLSFALKYHIRYARLLEMNDLPDAPLASNMYIYLEHKNIKGAHETHVVKPGEMLIQVAQAEGIQLRRLMTLNHLEWGEEPAGGAVLQLQDFADTKPELITSVSNGHTAKAPKAGVVIRQGSNIKVVKDNPVENPKPIAPVQKPVSAEVATTNTANDYIDTKPQNTNTPVVSTPKTTPVAAPVKADVSQTAQPANDYIDTKTQNTNTPVVNESETTTAAAAVTAETPKPAQQSDYIDTKPAQIQAIDNGKNDETTVVKEAPAVAEQPVMSTPQEPKKAVVANDPEGIDPQVIPASETKKEEAVEKAAVTDTKPVEEKQEIQQPKQDDDMIATKKTAVKTEVVDTVAKETPKEEAPKDEQPKDPLDALKGQLDKVVYQDGGKPAVAMPQQNSEKKNDAAQANDDSKFYTVKDGDTAYSIAKDNNITVRQLMDWNDLDFNAIKTGDKLRVKE